MASRHLFTSLRPRGAANSGVLYQLNTTRPIRPAALAAGRYFASQPPKASSAEPITGHASDSASSKASSKASSEPSSSSPAPSPPSDWEDNPNYDISHFSELPHTNFGVNQHIVINDEFKEALRQILWQFRAPIRYAFAYGSGVFPQSKQTESSSSTTTSIHSKAPPAVEKAQGGKPKMIDFIFGVSYTQHWHSLNLQQHRNHYSALGSLGSGAVSAVQDKWGAGVYFNPFVTVNGTLIKYGVVNLDTLCTDLSEWDSLYLAGRLQKPVKILRDDPRVRLANQVNLLSALRTALLLLPPEFTEQELYAVIANISYMGDPRMAFPTEDKSKVANIVGNNLPHFRRLYSPLIENLPNVSFNDSKCSDPQWAADSTANVTLAQDMDPVKRGNMVRRLPKAFRSKLYFQYQKKYQIPRLEFNKMLESASDEDATRINRRQGGGFERRIANEPPEDLRAEVRYVIKKTIGWPSTVQSLKGILTSGVARSWRYLGEKIEKYKEGKRKDAEAARKIAEDTQAEKEKKP
ncbi:related to proline transport helper PTH1 C. albicans [Rhynchosporium agropyri]|uniref:Phosphatidate cytidylyltransferase, mitochondrial n=1 Tax=Rhynchosporium agropyri TaxID=914238 RepID=A0A1E1LQG2_9HELO|nr:related to proline transport helper PTH1 C. albicans [Rhynchosporium agropyri]